MLNDSGRHAEHRQHYHAHTEQSAKSLATIATIPPASASRQSPSADNPRIHSTPLENVRKKSASTCRRWLQVETVQTQRCRSCYRKRLRRAVRPSSHLPLSSFQQPSPTTVSLSTPPPQQTPRGRALGLSTKSFVIYHKLTN